MPTKTKYIYVASDAAGRHKVGFTENPKLRRYHLARNLRRPVCMVHVEAIDGGGLAETVERFAHWELAAHHDGGEWFCVSAEKALSAVEVGKAKAASGENPPIKIAVAERYQLPAEMVRRVASAARPGETMRDFIREAVEAELKRREQEK